MTMRNGIRAGLAMAAVAVAAGCASAPSPATAPAPVITRGVAAVEPAADPRPLGAADTAFGLDVLRAWCAQYPRHNLVCSPSTLATALGMAYLGARGTTAQVMARVLHLPVSGGNALEAELQARSTALGQPEVLRGLQGAGCRARAAGRGAGGGLRAGQQGAGCGGERAPAWSGRARGGGEEAGDRSEERSSAASARLGRPSSTTCR